MTEDQFWRDIVNGLKIEKDLVGDPVFVAETEEPEEGEPTDPENVGDKEAAVIRLKIEVYMISVIGEKQVFMVTGKSAMDDAGVMTVRDAIKLIERRKKR